MSKVYVPHKKPVTSGAESDRQSTQPMSNQAVLELLKAPENLHAKSLSQEMSQRMSQHFGVSLDGLKVFENETLNRLGETAFAHGNEIHVAKGQFSPDTAHGQEILMHEAAHVVQQGMGLAHDTAHESPALEAQANAVQTGGTMSAAGFSMPTATAAAPIQGFGRRLLKKIKSGWNSFKNLFKKKAPAQPEPEPAPAPAPAQSGGFDFTAVQRRGMSKHQAQQAKGFETIERIGSKKHRHDMETQELGMAMNEQYRMWNKTLTPEEHESVIKYTTNYYRDMNSQLRYGGDDDEVQQDIDNVSSAVKKSVLPADMVLHRGASSKVIGQLLGFDASGMDSTQLRKHLMQNKDSLLHQHVSDKGFTSTSLDENIARSFAGTHSGHLVQINAKAGSHGAYLDPISESIGEKEILLDKGQKFSVSGIEEVEGMNGLMRIILDMVDDNDEGALW